MPKANVSIKFFQSRSFVYHSEQIELGYENDDDVFYDENFEHFIGKCILCDGGVALRETDNFVCERLVIECFQIRSITFFEFLREITVFSDQFAF